MKSIKDLQAIRERALDSVNMRKDQDGIRIVVGMATCGHRGRCASCHAQVCGGDQPPPPAECDGQPDRMHRHVPL